MRLDRYLVTLGRGSRTEVQKLIRSGAVTVDGTPVRDPGFACREPACLTLQGEALDTRLMRHVLLHKPAGLLTAAQDKKQPTVMDLLPPVYTAIGCMPVGRLDKDTTGLLLLTCDGELNHRLLAPQRHVDKTYLARVDGILTPALVETFAAGMDLGDFVTKPAELTMLEPHLARLTIHEGKFHQVKRMFEHVGLTVEKLHRVSFGPLTLPEDLPEGMWRELTAKEEAAVYQAAQMEAQA